MEMVMSNCFTELSTDEMIEIDGGKSGWDYFGDVCGAICAGGSAYLIGAAAVASGPVGWVAYAGAAGAAAWVAYKS